MSDVKVGTETRGPRLCRWLGAAGASDDQKRMRIANGIVWAAVTIATSLLLSGKDRDTAATIVCVILIPAWCATDMILMRPPRC